MVAAYVGELQDACDDEEKFERVLTKIKDDPRLAKGTLTEIVNSYSSHEGAFKSRADAHKKLKSAFVEQVRFRNKLR